MTLCIHCGDRVKGSAISSCDQCYKWLGGKSFATTRDCQRYVLRRLEMALRKLSRAKWRQKEIDELGPNLRSAIPNSERKFRKLEDRIAHAKSHLQT